MKSQTFFLQRVLFLTLFLTSVGGVFALEPSKIDFGALSVSCDSASDPVALTLAKDGRGFAKTEIARGEVEAVEEDGKTLTVALKNGKRFVFSGIHAEQGFIAIDYVQTGDAFLTSEEPLRWETTVFDADAFDSVKAFGTAGLRKVDGHAGSYAFLALVEPETRSGVVGGWITSEKAGGVVRSEKNEGGVPTMIPRLDYGKYQTRGRQMEERLVLGGFDDCRVGLEEYAEAVAKHYSVKLNQDCLVGYCTWYSDRNGGACNETAIRELADSLFDNFGDFGLQFVQIDDGWQLGASKNGPNKNFTAHNPNGRYPSGMKATSDFLASKKLTAGLWFMPFSGNHDDPYFADKQDMFVRSAIDYPAPGEKNTRRFSSINQKKNEPYETFWGGTCLDVSNPKTREYVKDVVTRITQDWNYKYIKIDGMWCGSGLEQLYVNDEYFPEDMGEQIFYDPTTTNVENYRTGMELVRDAAKGTFILGCNVSQNMRVMAASYGLVDAMRIGPDNGASWNGVCAGPIRGTNRYFYNGRVWYNDPDPVYVRTSIPLDRARVSATWAGLTGQLYALSDWVPDYDAERVDVVRKTIPNHLRKTVRPVDLFDVDLARVWLLTDDASGPRRDVVGLFNWNGDEETVFELTPEKLGLPLVDEKGEKIERYVAFDFWNDQLVAPFETLKTTLPKASCAVLAVRPVGDRPILLSTSRHISQGILEVRSEKWNPETKTLEIVTDVPAGIPYQLRVYNPGDGVLERFTTPEGTVGVTTVRYDAKAPLGERFSVVK